MKKKSKRRFKAKRTWKPRMAIPNPPVQTKKGKSEKMQ